jgi:ATP-binding cassette subfamily F protein uup
VAEVVKPAPAKVKLSYKEQRELDELPTKMAALESEQAAIVAELELGDVFSKDAPRAAQIANRLTEIEAELLACLTRWEELEAKA